MVKRNDVIKIGKKCFEVSDIIYENSKKKYIIKGLGSFFEDEIKPAGTIEKFLYHIFGTK